MTVADRSARRLRTSRLARNLRLAGLGARVGGVYAGTAARKTFASAERRAELDRTRELATAQQVADELGRMKGALMKLGQMASYLDEGLPEPLRQALSQLQSNAPPMATELVIATVEAELGRPIGELFVEFDPEPIAAASIGQVHRAIVIDPATGAERAVAVKVQYPGIGEAIESDLRNADLLGTILRQGFGGLDPDEMVDEIKLRLTEELDYRIEARNQAGFVDDFRGHPFIRIPEVLPAFSTARVLTSELVVGFGWQELLERPQAERDRAGEIIFRFVFRSLYTLGAFNGDPHPGNYVFHDDGTVTFLDFGLVKHFTPTEMGTFASMVKAAVVDRDAAHFRTVLESAGMLRPDAPVSTEDVGRVLRPLLRRGARRRGDDLDERVRQLDRPPHVRPQQPDQPVRHRAPRVRVHPAHQPRAVRPAGSAAGSRQLPAHRRGTLAVHARRTVDRPRSCRGRVARRPYSVMWRAVTWCSATWARRTAASSVAAMRRTVPPVLLAPIVVLGLGLAACGSDGASTSDSSGSLPAPGSDPAADSSAAPGSDPTATVDDAAPSTTSPDKPAVSIPDEIPTELQVTVLEEGTGPAAETGDTVIVDYVGVRSSDGVEFDNSYDGGEPFPVVLGTEQRDHGLGAGSRRRPDRRPTAARHPGRSGLRSRGPRRRHRRERGTHVRRRRRAR